MAAFLGMGSAAQSIDPNSCLTGDGVLDRNRTEPVIPPPWIDSIRHTTLGGLVLGFGFLWSDLACYAAGVGLGVTIEMLGNADADPEYGPDDLVERVLVLLASPTLNPHHRRTLT